MKVLVADPSPTMAELLASALKGIGVGSAVKVTDSEAAWRMLNAEPFGAALLDFNLRPKGASEFALGLRRSGIPNAHIPIIGIATSRDPDGLRAAMLAGINKVVVKPVSGDNLRARFEAIFAAADAPISPVVGLDDGPSGRDFQEI